jgi:hypothetical protein
MLRQIHDSSRQSAHPAKSREHRTMSETSATHAAINAIWHFADCERRFHVMVSAHFA